MHTGLNRSSINLDEKQGYPLHLAQRSDPTLQWLNSQTNSITELIYWIQYVSYVLFKWQTGINNWCSPSIIIFATLVTWFPSPLPTQHCSVQEHPNPLWAQPTAGGIFTHYIILHMLKHCNQYNMTYFVAHVPFFYSKSWEGGDVTVHINWWFTLWKSFSCCHVNLRGRISYVMHMELRQIHLYRTASNPHIDHWTSWGRKLREKGIQQATCELTVRYFFCGITVSFKMSQYIFACATEWAEETFDCNYVGKRYVFFT